MSTVVRTAFLLHDVTLRRGKKPGGNFLSPEATKRGQGCGTCGFAYILTEPNGRSCVGWGGSYFLKRFAIEHLDQFSDPLATLVVLHYFVRQFFLQNLLLLIKQAQDFVQDVLVAIHRGSLPNLRRIRGDGCCAESSVGYTPASARAGTFILRQIERFGGSSNRG
jgi:hypothetical protein